MDKHILIIDDEPDVLDTTGQILRQEGYRVTTASNGEEGLKLFKFQPFDMVITDYRMPIMDGFEVIRQVKQIDPDMEIVILTGFATLDNAVQSLRHDGAFDYLNKPLDDIDGLLMTVERAVEKRKLVLENRQKTLDLINANTRLEKQIQERLRIESDLNLSNRALKTVSESSRSVTMARDERGLCEKICNIIVTQGQYRLAWVGVPNQDGDKTVSIAAQAGVDDGYLENLELTWADSVRGRGPTGTAIRTQKPAISQDILNNPDFAPWRDAARERGYSSSISLPLLLSGQVIGTLNIYSGRPHAFDVQEVDLLSELSMNLSYGIQTIRTRMERAEAQKALKESEEKYRTLVHNATDAIFITQDNIIKFPNPKTCELIGYSVEDLSSIPFIEIVHPDDRRQLNRHYIAQLHHERPPESFMLRVLKKDGETLWVMISVSQIQWEGRAAALNVLKDMTLQKKMEEQQAKSQKMEALGTLAGGIAHDFNNILAAIVGFNELAKLDLPPGSAGYDHLEEAIKAGLHAKELIRQILTFSRMRQDDQIPISIRHIVNDTLRLLRSTLPTTVDIRKNIHPTGLIMANPSQIQQVVMNLATNALQAMEGGFGVLTVELEEVSIGDSTLPAADIDLEKGRYVRLTVGDTGHGMDHRTMSRIFDPYYSTRSKSGGTGLGLSVVHGIVTQCSGNIQVRSHLDEGTTFELYFPVVEGKAPVKTNANRTIPRGNESVLYVDDDERISKMGHKLLQHLGYSPTTHGSSRKALEDFRDRPDAFDILITDMTMPEMTGLQLALEMKEIKPDLPVILCTGYNENVDEASALDLGINAFYLKPLRLNEFARVIRDVLDPLSK